MKGKPVRRGAAPDYEQDAVLNLPQGADLKIAGIRPLPPRFDEETGDFRAAAYIFTLEVIDDRDEGEDNGKTFGDFYELKFDREVAAEHGIGPVEGAKDSDGKKLSFSKFLRNANREQFSAEQAVALLDEGNWIAQENTKLGNLAAALLGKNWELPYGVEALDGLRFRAVVEPKTGKKEGSLCAWKSFSSLDSLRENRDKMRAAAELTEDEVADMNAALAAGDAA